MSKKLNFSFEAGKNALTTDFKWCQFVVCPAEGGLLFNNYWVKCLLFSAMMFGVKFVQM